MKFNAAMALGDNIKAFRERKRWSTYDLAHEVGTAQSNISRYEQNKARPRQPLLERIAKSLGAEVAQLEYGSVEFEVLPLGKRRVPILDYAQVGQWAHAASPHRNDEMNDSILVSAEFSSQAFALILRGESMLPVFRPGDILAVDPAISPNPGNYVVAVNHLGEATVRTWAHLGVNGEGKDIIELRPANPLFPVWNSETQPFRLVGTVVESTRRYRSR